MVDELKEDIPIILKQEIITPEKNAPVLIERIEVVEDELKIDETIIESTETDESEAIVVSTKDILEVEEAEEIIEDIPFVLIEDVPVYPGCKGNNKELKDCFTKKIEQFFAKNFDINLPREIGLDVGKKRVFVIFKVNKEGYITNVNAKAPHPRIKKEVIEVLNALPRMTPGKQRGRPVGVTYSLPITFHVQ